MKHVKLPTAFNQPLYKDNLLYINGLLAIKSCERTQQSIGSMCLQEHMLLFVLDGVNTLTHGKQKYKVHKNEMVLIKKATIWKFNKVGNPDNNNIYDSMLFFLKDEFLKNFLKIANIKVKQTDATEPITVKSVNERLHAFVNSIKPYFNDAENIDAGLLHIKMMELLYDIAGTDNDLLQQILQLNHPDKADIVSVMEQNYTNPLSLSEFAYLSGRSLSGFKRDFASTYNMPPSQWIREKRLEKAQELLSNTTISVTDICYLSGFENITHFSRIFKEQFGYSPSGRRTK